MKFCARSIYAWINSRGITLNIDKFATIAAVKIIAKQKDSMKNLKIGTRLGMGFGIVLLLMAALIVIVIMRMSQIGSSTDVLLKQELVKFAAINVINSSAQANSSLTMEMFIAPDQAHIDSLKQRIASNRKLIDDQMLILDRLVHRAEAKAMLAKLKETRSAYVNSYSKVTSLLSAGNKDEASQLMRTETTLALQAMNDQIKEFDQFFDKVVLVGAADVSENISSTTIVMIGLGLFSLVLGIASAYLVTRSIIIPIRESVKIAEMVAAGDLTCKIEINSTDEIGTLLQALKLMTGSLQEIVAQVRSGTDCIATASSQIASGNLDLSARTEQQAGSLEETASSMEELTSTVKQNADNARQANQLAISASEIAIKGGSVVSEVVETMSSINASSKKIVDIISVIDGIAFQTNILALNAAVEAARAGEQGRGFAVVASEVRNLAQRSAAAAKEIKELINTSVENVEVGTKLVDQAGSTMAAIVNSIQSVTDIMGEITAASQEQTAGIEQINQAIIQMDDITQQNAALVEEAAAAAAALEDQAVSLVNVVGVFKTVAGASSLARSGPALRVVQTSESEIAYQELQPFPVKRLVNR
jgi:methyl-accepting chemotaxis protein